MALKGQLGCPGNRACPRGWDGGVLHPPELEARQRESSQKQGLRGSSQKTCMRAMCGSVYLQF